MDVYFDAVLQAAAAGESGTLTVSADEEDWSNAADVELKAAGENVVTVKVTVDHHALPYRSDIALHLYKQTHRSKRYGRCCISVWYSSLC